MFVISKKRLGIIFGTILFSMFAFLIANDNISTSKNLNTVQTVALPVTNKVIVIDARTWSSR